jgi:hypothetical protein
VKKTRQNLEPFAGVGVTNRRHKEAEAEGQHDNVEHVMFQCGVISGVKKQTSLWFIRWWVLPRCIGFRDGSGHNIIGIL